MKVERFIIKNESTDRIVDKKMAVHDRVLERNIVEVIMDTNDKIIDEIIAMAKKMIEEYYEALEKYVQETPISNRHWDDYYSKHKNEIHGINNEELLRKLSGMAEDIINSACDMSHTIEDEL